MEKINECTCTPAYYLPDENQWEPSHTCMNCRLEEEAYYQERRENTTVLFPISLAVVTENYDDDLPF
jgi:hypothetical protein